MSEQGQAFQFTFGGMRVLTEGEGGLVPSAEVIPHAEPAPQALAEDQTEPRVVFRAPVQAPAGAKEQLKPRNSKDVVKQAKSRLKDIKAELKYHDRLKKEAAELERLIAAAKEKPSNLRSIKRAG